MPSNKYGRKKQSKKVAANRRRKQRASRLTMEGLESRELLTVLTFQQGVGGYSSQQDTVLYSRDADTNFGTEGSVSPDQQDSNGVRQGLVKFGNIIGDGPGQIPVGSTINSATLTFNVINDSNSAMQMSAYRMLVDWTESTATWNSFGSIGGVQASEGEASDLPPDDVLFDPDTSAENPATAGIFDVTRSLRSWASGADNFGWVLESAATNGWDYTTKEGGVAPKLVVDYTAPAGAGTVQFFDTATRVGEENGTHTAQLDLIRVGGTSGMVSVNYAITAGTADGTDVTLASGTVDFADGVATASVPVEILGDTDLEGNENFTVTLTGAVQSGVNDVATVTIADDDALINEVLANISTPTGETDKEFIELIGTPGASLDDYYFVVFEAEEEEGGGQDDGDPSTSGHGTGVADLVIDLSGQTFGSNGLLVITPTNWAYAGNVAGDGTGANGTRVFATTALDGAGGVLEDASQTYSLIFSPLSAIVQGTDYDTVGAYENTSNQAIGTGVGILDQLPAGAQVVDSVGVVEGGGDDRDRTLAPPEIGNPGIHVHQPTAINASSGNVTSDAVSRRFGQTLPNSIGAWFNGDVADDGTGDFLRYQNDSFFISVVAPDGSVVTPGAPNILRTVFFSVADQNTTVAEADGSVTLRIERTGDIANESVTVTYSTVDFGSATDGADYTGVTDQTVTFNPGESFKDIVIDITENDGVAEGFERFRVDITDVTGDYLITNGKPNESGAVNGEAVVTIEDMDVSTATFQNGVNGYFGTQDAYIDGDQIFGRFGQSDTVSVDAVKGEGELPLPVVRPQQGLIKFDDMFGAGAGQVPLGSTIFDAFLTVNVTNPGGGQQGSVNFFRMLQNWEEVNTSWVDPQGSVGAGITNGVTPDNVEAAVSPDGTAETGRTGLVQIQLDVDTIQSWANGSLDNYGWSIVNELGSLWGFNSSEAFLAGTFRPELTILYTEPTESAGTFSLSVDEYTVNEQDVSATITVNRIGGSDGAATVDWTLTPYADKPGAADDARDAGQNSDVNNVLSGQVSFADGEISKTFSVSLNDDIELETSEWFDVTISGTGLDFGRDAATLEIRDNDFNLFADQLLLNEIWINSPGNDPPFEFVEMIGDAGIDLGSLYYVAFEGLVGDRTGVAEKVVSLADYSNGLNGLSLLTPDAADFGFNVPTATTQIDLLGSIGQENVASQNDSTTYMILYSPFTELTSLPFDYDWDDDGALELPTGVQIVDSLGVRVFGATDQLYGPSTNRAAFSVSDPEVDAVTRTRGNTARNTGGAWFGGDLFPAGDDYLAYEAVESFGLPVDGAALSPGEENVGSDAQTPLVSLTGVASNPDGTVTLTFNGPVSQFNLGNGDIVGPGGAAISLTDDTGHAVPGVDVLPSVDGFFTNTLTLTFTGTAVDANGGMLPALASGSYQLNFVGNAIIGNGRQVDAGNLGSSAGSEAVFQLSAAGSDFNGDGVVDILDLDILSGNFGTAGGATLSQGDANGDGNVDILDLDILSGEFGSSGGWSMVSATPSTNVAAPALALAVGGSPSEEKSADVVFEVIGDLGADDDLLLYGPAIAEGEEDESEQEVFEAAFAAADVDGLGPYFG